MTNKRDLTHVSCDLFRSYPDKCEGELRSLDAAALLLVNSHAGVAVAVPA